MTREGQLLLRRLHHRRRGPARPQRHLPLQQLQEKNGKRVRLVGLFRRCAGRCAGPAISGRTSSPTLIRSAAGFTPPAARPCIEGREPAASDWHRRRLLRRPLLRPAVRHRVEPRPLRLARPARFVANVPVNAGLQARIGKTFGQHRSIQRRRPIECARRDDPARPPASPSCPGPARLGPRQRPGGGSRRPVGHARCLGCDRHPATGRRRAGLSLPARDFGRAVALLARHRHHRRRHVLLSLPAGARRWRQRRHLAGQSAAAVVGVLPAGALRRIGDGLRRRLHHCAGRPASPGHRRPAGAAARPLQPVAGAVGRARHRHHGGRHPGRPHAQPTRPELGRAAGPDPRLLSRALLALRARRGL